MDGLMMHTPGSRYVNRAQIEALPDPVAMGARHAPIPHRAVIEALEASIARNGWSVENEQWGLAGKGHKLFGVMKIAGTGITAGDGLGLTLGVRASTNESLSLRGIAGLNVFVCDNLMFDGSEFVMQRKFTTGMRLYDQIRSGLDKFYANSATLGSFAERMQNQSLSPLQFKAHMFNMIDHGVLPTKLFRPVIDLYREEDKTKYPDCAPNSVWGLNNSCTRAVKKLKPQSKLEHEIEIGGYFKRQSDRLAA
tara:strand:+ start:3558 stop:4310 length:753 start_codon:yes stop_codon:yes gene_type:complete